MKKTLAGAAICAALILGSSGAAFAGEVGGSGKGTQGPAHANSACVYSGLEDGSEPGTTAGPGNVQNWGHAKNSPDVVSLRGAAEAEVTFEVAPGVFVTVTTGCNPHVGGGPE
ncbi:MAG TPA: hypothetical protein VEX42_10170 [Microbacterium sp.]|nr:hypothetical protein [Microbacterium sp.]